MTNARLAGSDTREAARTRTVRLAARAAFFTAGPVIAAIAGLSAAWDDALGLRPPLASLLTLLGGLGVGMLAWRLPAPRAHPSAIGPSPLAATAVFAALLAMHGDARLVAFAMPVLVVVGAGVIGDLARLAASATNGASRSAAAGIVLAGGTAGSIPAIHLLLVGSGAGLPRAAGWVAAEALFAAIASHAAQRAHTAPGVSAPRAPTTAALTVEGITVSFGTNHVLSGASLAIEPGELVALVGGNGSGKSTLLRAAAGLVTPEHGRIALGEDDITVLRADERAAAGLAFVSGARPIFPDLSVEQNLRVAAYRTHRGAELREAIAQVLSLVPTLASRRGVAAGVLSGGEQRLLAVAATMFSRPSVLLADELTLGLDPQARRRVLDLLRAFADDGVAVIVVDHDLASLLPRAHRAVLLDAGALADFPDPLTLFEARRDLLPATFLAGVDG